MRNLGRDIADFFFPRTCMVCGRVLLHNEEHICTHCILEMPRTDYALLADNPMAQLFYGKLPVECAAAYFFFAKGSDYRTLIHRIKYNNRKECGLYLGQLFAREYRSQEIFKDVDFVVPVPLHWRKKLSRGYNQSEWIARGVSSETGIPMCCKELVCTTHRVSQTQKGIYERYLSTRQVFELKKNSSLIGKRVLLVDDVVTTGATLLACGEALMKGGVSRVSMLTLAEAR